MANKYKKFVATAATATLVASAIVPVASAAPSDIEGNQFEGYILDAIELGLFQDNASFNPNNTLTRGHVVLILGRYLETAGFEPAADYATNPAFADMNTSADEEYLRTASIVKEAGVFTGSNGEINWKAPIKREAMAAVLDRLAGAVTGKTLVEQAASVEDVTIADLATAQKQFQAQIQALRDLEISTVENFNPKGDVKRGQFAKFVMEALSVVEQIKAEQEENTEVPGETTPDTGDVDVPAETTAAISEVKAASVKTITVTFENAVDAAAATFAVKKGSSALTSEVSWNEEKTVATLTLAGKITEGKYTVTVSGLTEEALTGEFTAQNEAVAEIKVLTTETPLVEGTSADTVKVAYQLLNQYGEDVTKSTVLGTDLTITSTKGTATDDKKGVITLSAPEFKAGDKATVVIVDKKTAKTATATVTVVDSTVLDSITLGEVFNAKGLELSEDNKADQYVLAEGFDQYGETFEFAASNVTIVSSNPEVATFEVSSVKTDEDKDAVQAFKINAIKAGTTTLTIVSNATGKTVSKEITVAPAVKADKVVIGDATGVISADKAVYFPLEVTNNKGEVVTKAADANKVTYTLSNGKSATAVVKEDGKLYLEVDTTFAKNDIKNTLVITAQTETNNTVTKVVEVLAKAVATELVGFDKEVSLNVLAGNTLEIATENFIVNDQYGERMEENYAIDATLVEGENFVVSNVSEGVSIDATKATKTATVKFALVGTDSAIETKVSVVTAADFASYEVSEVPTMYATTSGDTFVVDADYNEALVVKAVTADGKVVTLTEGADYLVDGKPAAGEAIKFEEKATEAKVTATITINATGAKLTKELTYSNVAPAVENFVFTSSADAATVELAKVKELTGVQEVAGTLAAANFLGDIKVVTVDQYGKYAVVTEAPVITVVPSKVAEVKVTNNGTANAQVELATDVEESTVTVEVKVGKVTKSIEVKLVK